MTTGRTRSTAPMSPWRNPNAPNTATVVTNDATTPGATSRVPSTAASMTDRPALRWRAMFSAITMASSIIRPTPMSRATMVIMLKE